MIHTISPETPEQHALRFPKLTDAQISQLRASGATRHVNRREILFDQETAGHGVFIVLSGSIEILDVSNGVESVLRFWGLGNSPAR